MMSEESQLMGQSFAKSYRLCRKSEYSFVFKKAKKVSDNYFLILSRDQQKGMSRLGLAVAKKHARLAVERNRIKRIIRESFRHQQNTMPSVDLVVMIKPGAVQVTNNKLLKSLEKLWLKL